ncbi:MAG: 30S ribosomal protein S6 [Bacilli bacterium]|nr:30S ribosomal protein S6 [Bacilli bacterium]
MNKYELIFIVKPDLEESQIKGVNDSIKAMLLEKKANILEAKEWGQKELAYEINKYKTGYYFYYLIEEKGSKAEKEFNRVALINENIIRHITVKVEE